MLLFIFTFVWINKFAKFLYISLAWIFLNSDLPLPNTYVVVTLALAHDQGKGLKGCGPRWRLGSHITCSQECKECEGMNPHTPKWTPMFGVGVPNGVPNFQSTIAKVKTHCLEEFFISLENYWSINA